MLVLDANILIRAVLGRRVRQLLETNTGRGTTPEKAKRLYKETHPPMQPFPPGQPGPNPLGMLGVVGQLGQLGFAGQLGVGQLGFGALGAGGGGAVPGNFRPRLQPGAGM